MADQSMNGSPRLRDYRRGCMMTQQEVAERLDELAWLLHKRRVGINPDMVSKWERGQKRPSAFYLKLLCALYDASPADLGFAPARQSVIAAAPVGSNPPLQADLLDLVGPRVEVLQASLFSLWRQDMLNRRQLLAALGLTPAAIGLSHLEVPLGMHAPTPPVFHGDETITELEALVRRLESAYHSAQPDKLLLPARALADAAEGYLDVAGTPRIRRSLLQVVSRAQLLAGRLSFFDLHRPLDARAHLDLAREAAIEAQDPLLVSAALGHMAFLPAEHRHLAAASSYLEGARQEIPGEAAEVVGWLDAVESELQTRAGAYDAAQGMLQRARGNLASESNGATPEWFDFFDEVRLAGFEGFALRNARNLDAARGQLEHAVAGISLRFPKQRSVTMLDLASVCAEQGDIDAGCALATDAVVSLREAGYATAVDRLREFSHALPDTGHPAARLLEEAIVELS
jgi:transcriptional regulator with XRE-family HTH domain